MKPFDIVNSHEPTLALVSVQGTVRMFRESEESLDPTDDQFDFSLWAKAVKKQMMEALERRNKDKVGTKS